MASPLGRSREITGDLHLEVALALVALVLAAKPRLFTTVPGGSQTIAVLADGEALEFVPESHDDYFEIVRVAIQTRAAVLELVTSTRPRSVKPTMTFLYWFW